MFLVLFVRCTFELLFYIFDDQLQLATSQTASSSPSRWSQCVHLRRYPEIAFRKELRVPSKATVGIEVASQPSYVRIHAADVVYHPQ